MPEILNLRSLISLVLLSFLLSAFLIFSVCQNSQAVSLQEAINQARSSNKNIELEQARLKVTKTEKSKAISEFLPSVKASVQYGNRNSFFNGQTYDRSGKQRTDQISLEQPIFDGLHSVSKFREANYKIKSSSAKTSDKIQEISFAAIQSFCNLFRYQKLAEIYQENQKLGKNFYDLVKRRKDVQIIDNAEIIKFDFETSLTEEKYLDAINRLNKAKFEYQNIVGEIDGELSEPKITLEKFDRKKTVDAVLSNNFSLNSYKFNYLAAKTAVNAEKSTFLPKVYLTASRSKESNVLYLNGEDLDARSVAVNVSIPIFQQGLEYANVARASYEKEAALIEYEINKQDLVKEINNLMEEYEFLAKINQANQRLLNLAKKRADVFKRRTDLRVEDPIENIRVKIELNERKASFIESQMNLIISYYKIKYFLSEI